MTQADRHLRFPVLALSLALPCLLQAGEPARSAEEGQTLTRTQALVTPEREAEDVAVRNCWVRATPLPDLPTAAYFDVRNDRRMTMELTGVETPAFATATLNQTVSGDGPARMMEISSVPIAPSDYQRFVPGGYHALLDSPQDPPTIGESVPMVFLFGSDGRVETQCLIQPPTSLGYEGATGPSADRQQ